MRIALIDSTPRAKVYPLSLLKIGAWQEERGNECKIFNNHLPVAGEYDEIWVTTLFTYDIPHAVGIVKEAKNRAASVRVGGVSATLLPKYFEMPGVDVHIGLVPEAENHHPNYSLLGSLPEYSIAHTSRGCVRRCGFCMVPKLEPRFANRPGWENDIHPATKRVLFFDNNWLAKRKKDLQSDIDKLRELIAGGRIKEIDFNQGLDARLMTEELAGMLKGLPIKPVRFAFDGMQEDGYYQRAVETMAERGFRSFVTYVLYNFEDTPADLYYRLCESVLLEERLNVSVQSFPMQYQPILEVNPGRGYVGSAWTLKKRNNFRSIVGEHSAGTGQVAAHGGTAFIGSMAEFEYWFGETADQFNKLLSYPRLKELLKKKQGSLRMDRAMGGAAPTRTLQT